MASPYTNQGKSLHTRPHNANCRRICLDYRSRCLWIYIHFASLMFIDGIRASNDQDRIGGYFFLLHGIKRSLMSLMLHYSCQSGASAKMVYSLSKLSRRPNCERLNFTLTLQLRMRLQNTAWMVQDLKLFASFFTFCTLHCIIKDRDVWIQN